MALSLLTSLCTSGGLRLRNPTWIFIVASLVKNLGGRGEIRTHGPVSETPVFRTGALDHSATLPYTYLFESYTIYHMRYLGIDYGSKRIGLALSDEAGTMGFPHAIVPNTPRLVVEICSLIEREGVGAVVIGESRNLSGHDNPIAEAARVFGDSVARISQKPIFYESEVFTSAEARRAPEKEIKSRAVKRRGAIDNSAAALILTSYLSRIGTSTH